MWMRALLPINRMVAAYLLLTTAAIVVMAGVGGPADAVYAVVAALIVRDLLVGMSAAVIWRRRPSVGRGVAPLLGASITASVRGRGERDRRLERPQACRLK